MLLHYYQFVLILSILLSSLHQYKLNAIYHLYQCLGSPVQLFLQVKYYLMIRKDNLLYVHTTGICKCYVPFAFKFVSVCKYFPISTVAILFKTKCTDLHGLELLMLHSCIRRKLQCPGLGIIRLHSKVLQNLNQEPIFPNLFVIKDITTTHTNSSSILIGPYLTISLVLYHWDQTNHQQILCLLQLIPILLQ